ncbi:conserved hypothetical protein [Paraburkholderia caribensis]|jgi:hypothetical protein|nr:conserved hypothetical protein [Paraburkholderia caribensis]
MSGQCKSLRVLVKDWFGNGGRFKVTRADRSKTMSCRVVKVEVAHSSGTYALVFFRHNDGSWCVYPPPIVHPTMNWA